MNIMPPNRTDSTHLNVTEVLLPLSFLTKQSLKFSRVQHTRSIVKFTTSQILKNRRETKKNSRIVFSDFQVVILNEKETIAVIFLLLPPEKKKGKNTKNKIQKYTENNFVCVHCIMRDLRKCRKMHVCDRERETVPKIACKECNKCKKNNYK